MNEDEDSDACDGCGAHFADGQHFMNITVTLDTHGMPPPVVEVPATTLTGKLCTPGCFRFWANDEPVLRDVFSR